MSEPITDGNGPLIDCRSVWKVFGKKSDAAIRAIAERGLGKTEVLKEFGCVVGVANVSLTLNKGEIFCIMGLSGSGKSTLIRLFNRLIEPSLGKILVRGNDIAAMNAEQLRETRARHVGMVFQNVALLPHRTVLENAAFGLEVQKVDKAKRLEDREGRPGEGRPRRLGQPLPQRAVGRHAAARGPRPRARRRPRDHPDGRAVQRARSAHPAPAAGPVPPALEGAGQVGDLHHARSRRGHPHRRPHRHHEGRCDHPGGHGRGHRAEARPMPTWRTSSPASRGCTS